MNHFGIIWSIIVVLQCFWLATSSGGRRRSQRAIQPICQKYRGKFCSKYLQGKTIYLTKNQRAGENHVKHIYRILNGKITDRCMKHTLPALCYSLLPPCDPTSKVPKKLEICQEDCFMLKEDVCKLEFTYARENYNKYARNCSSLPAHGQPGYERCLRITMKAITFSASVQNISMYEGKSVTLKCRLSTKKIPVNITWLKDGAPISSRFKIKTFRWGSRLRVRRVRAEDGGKYQCFVSGAGKVIQAVGWLKIRRRDNGQKNGNDVTLDPPVHPITGSPRQNTKRPGKQRHKYPRCKPYQGKTCAEFMRGDMVFAFTSQHIEKIELDYKDTLNGIRAAPHMTSSCKKYAIRALCYHIFKTCDTKKVEMKAKLCRRDCFSLYDDVCATELHLAKKDPRIAKLLPNCSKLPTKAQEDSKFCSSLGINDGIDIPPPMLEGVFLSHLEKSKDENCYNSTGSDYLGRHNKTKSGHTCKQWGMYDPVYNFSHNYCRNPRNHRESPWCYVSDTEYDLCDLPKCSDVVSVVKARTVREPKHRMTVNHTIYVICIIMAVLVVAFVSIIVYLKFQHRRNSLTYRDNSSSGSISKSTQSTVHQPSNDFKQSLLDVKSCCFNVMDDGNQGKVKFLKVLGEGAFARVCKGVLMNGDLEESDVQLAIKRLKSNVQEKVVENFRNEINVLADLQDINVLCLVGVSVNDPYFMVFEYYGDMDLNQFLRQHTPSYTTVNSETDPDEVMLLDFALQAASGLDYFVEKHFIHRDIACRNCYITKDRIIKISNLGIANAKYPSDYSWVHGSALLPVRWMAPEALNSLQCTHQSDIWSYGVLLWEIYSYGRQPYTGSSNQEAIEHIRRLQPLSCPDLCPARIYSLMKECWKENSCDRPNSIDICSTLRSWAGDSIGENH